MSGLSSGVVMVSAGTVRELRCVFSFVRVLRAWDDFWLRLFVVHGCQMLRAVAVVGCVFMLRSAPGVRGVCYGVTMGWSEAVV